MYGGDSGTPSWWDKIVDYVEGEVWPNAKTDTAYRAVFSCSQPVKAAFETFTERWSWGVRALVHAGNEIAKTLGLAAGRYHIMDEKFSNTFKEMFTQLTGNPHLSKEEIDARSWGETLADNQFNQIRHTDYSAESFQNAFTHIGTNVKVVEAVGPEQRSDTGDPAALEYRCCRAGGGDHEWPRWGRIGEWSR
ncbi:hypothetical protein [Nocardia vinacea]|uniref:hypothetical protein n=1 Tax=Nocardia vinacea TaxID=96468 RepID=UPI00030A1349|nr:hypothetical protein [Nocardia vinacea]